MNLQPREYQQKIIDSIKVNGNTLVVLPTGLGKTLIALSLMEATSGKCVFLTPTKPLATQHNNTITNVLGEVEGGSVLVTGDSPPKKRALLYQNHIISSTPQTIRNDIKNKIFPINEVSLIVFDEAHRAMGQYAYVPIAKALPEQAKIIALTASPGGDRAKIKQVLSNLRISNIEIRTPSDMDVSKYMEKMNQKWIQVELDAEYKEAQEILNKSIKKYTHLLRNSGVRLQTTSKGAFLSLRQKLFNMKHPNKYRLIYLYTCLLHTLHLQELLETQGREPVFKYITKLSNSNSKSAKTISSSTEIKRVVTLLNSGSDHPKNEETAFTNEKHQKEKNNNFCPIQGPDNGNNQSFEKGGLQRAPIYGKKRILY